jgi:hypothetical protein
VICTRTWANERSSERAGTASSEVPIGWLHTSQVPRREGASAPHAWHTDMPRPTATKPGRACITGCAACAEAASAAAARASAPKRLQNAAPAGSAAAQRGRGNVVPKGPWTTRSGYPDSCSACPSVSRSER